MTHRDFLAFKIWQRCSLPTDSDGFVKARGSTRPDCETTFNG